MFGGMEVKLHTFLTSVLDGCEWPASALKMRPRYLLDRNLVGPQSLSGYGVREKNPYFCQESNHSYLLHSQACNKSVF